MAIKIENLSSRSKLPSKTEEHINKLLGILPREHLRGLERLRLVDVIQDPRIRTPQVSATQLPGLYHPRQGSQGAWIEVALDVLLPRKSGALKRILPGLSFKANLAAVIFSLVGQHHFMTLRHSIKKGQLEASVRDYTEKNLRKWNESEHTFRARLFKPFQPILEKWAKSLQKHAAKAKKQPRASR